MMDSGALYEFLSDMFPLKRVCIHKSTTLPATNMEPEVLPSQKESCC